LRAIPDSRYYNKVIAIESAPSTLKTLRKTIELDRITNVRIIPKALSDKVGDATLYQWPDGPLGIGLLKEPFDYTGIMDRQLRMDDRDWKSTHWMFDLHVSSWTLKKPKSAIRGGCRLSDSHLTPL
jgi:FkbM family methyltransferase